MERKRDDRARVTRSCRENSPGLRERNHVRRIGREATGALSSSHTRCTSRSTREIRAAAAAAAAMEEEEEESLSCYDLSVCTRKNSLGAVDNLVRFANSRSHTRHGTDRAGFRGTDSLFLLADSIYSGGRKCRTLLDARCREWFIRDLKRSSFDGWGYSNG